MRIITTVLIWLISATLHAAPIHVASWNFEWLSTQNISHIKPSMRNERDNNKMKHYFDALQPDVLAFQEVNDLAAIRKITGPDYQIFFSDRSDMPERHFDDINQFTGFAVHPSLIVSDPQDVDLLPGQTHKLRFATYITVQRETTDKPLHLLSVHLKARCSGKYRASRDCKQLARQGKEVNQWIQERMTNEEAFVIAGDFNHDLSYPGDWLWAKLTRSVSPLPQLLSADTRPDCQVRSAKKPGQTFQFRKVIDHIVASPSLTGSRATQHVFSREDVLNYRLSDHCPVSSTVQLP